MKIMPTCYHRNKGEVENIRYMQDLDSVMLYVIIFVSSQFLLASVFILLQCLSRIQQKTNAWLEGLGMRILQSVLICINLHGWFSAEQLIE